MTYLEDLKNELRELALKMAYPLFIQDALTVARIEELKQLIAEETERLKQAEQIRKSRILKGKLKLYKLEKERNRLVEETARMKEENDKAFLEKKEELRGWFNRFQKEAKKCELLFRHAEWVQDGVKRAEIELEQAKNRPKTFFRDIVVKAYEKLENPTDEETKGYESALAMSKKELETIWEYYVLKAKENLLEKVKEFEDSVQKAKDFLITFRGTKSQYEKLKRKIHILELTANNRT